MKQHTYFLEFAVTSSGGDCKVYKPFETESANLAHIMGENMESEWTTKKASFICKGVLTGAEMQKTIKVGQ